MAKLLPARDDGRVEMWRVEIDDGTVWQYLAPQWSVVGLSGGVTIVDRRYSDRDHDVFLPWHRVRRLMHTIDVPRGYDDDRVGQVFPV